MRKRVWFRPLVSLAAIATTVSMAACDISSRAGSQLGASGSASPSASSSAPGASGSASLSPTGSTPGASGSASASPTDSMPGTSDPASPSPTGSVAPAQGQPGVPVKPISEHETWPAPEGRNRDRQLDYKGNGNPTVELPAALGDNLAAYTRQQLTWEKCGEAECATAKVPLDWENPGRASLDIALTRKPSANPTMGPLFFNNGGPGGSPRSVVQGMPADTVPGYDLVGWDPRGVGESTHVQCGTTEQTDAAWLGDDTPDDEAEKTALREGWAAYARQCRDASGELLDHLSTIENVRDLDLLRYLLGAEKLNYFGWSYGTFVGATYAELFPERSGRLVLDSAVNISEPTYSLLSVDGFEKALQHFADWCAGDSSCSLGDDRDAVMNRIDTFLKGLDTNPVDVGERKLTQTAATYGLGAALYGDATTYPELATALQEAMGGDGAKLLAYFDMMVGRKADGWSTFMHAYSAISCVDRPDLGFDAAEEDLAAHAAEAPVFTANRGVFSVCEPWTADSAPDLKLTGKGAGPILVVSSAVDPVTPHDYAEGMSKQLESASLLTWKGEGHGVALTGKSECATEAVVKFLTTGEAPADGASCPA